MIEVREWIQRLESCFKEPNSSTENALLDVLIGILRRADLEQSGEAENAIASIVVGAIHAFETQVALARRDGDPMLFSRRMKLKRELATEAAKKILEVLP